MMLETATEYLTRLKKNNNREWFQENKKEFESAKTEFVGFIESLIARITEFDSEIFGIDAKKCLFRIYRDIRFSRDKTPYKTNFGAYISPGGKKSDVAGYYIHLEPARSFLAGGLYKPSTESLLKVRTSIVNETEDFLEIVENERFKTYFPNLTDTDKLKTAPRGFPKDHEAIEYLRLKNLIAVHPLEDLQVASDDLPEKSAEVFEAMQDFLIFIRNACAPEL